MAQQQKTYKFHKMRAEAKKKQDGKPKKTIPPFVLDDVEPPITITAPTTLERQLGIGELIDSDGNFQSQDAKKLLRLLCGDAFGRVWLLVKDDEDPDTLIELVKALFQHFADELEPEAAELPGGSEAS